MADLAYIGFVLAFAVLGALAGLIAHFFRATSYIPEDLGFSEPWNSLTREDYQWEKHVIGAEWDDNGYWDGRSPRNLIYYMATGFAGPVFLGVIFWNVRHDVLIMTCKLLTDVSIHSPLCF